MGLLAAETGVQEQPAAHNAGQEVQLAGVLTKFHVAVDHQDEDEQNEVERQHGSQKLHLQVENIPMDVLCDIYAVLPEHVVHTAGEVDGREDRHTEDKRTYGPQHETNLRRPVRGVFVFIDRFFIGLDKGTVIQLVNRQNDRSTEQQDDEVAFSSIKIAEKLKLREGKNNPIAV